MQVGEDRAARPQRSIQSSASSRLKCEGCGAVAQSVDDPDLEPLEEGGGCASGMRLRSGV